MERDREEWVGRQKEKVGMLGAEAETKKAAGMKEKGLWEKKSERLRDTRGDGRKQSLKESYGHAQVSCGLAKFEDMSVWRYDTGTDLSTKLSSTPEI